LAQQESVSLVDDLDGGKAAETVAFGLDGATFEIDLSRKNATARRRALTEFVGHGGRVRAGASPAGKRNPRRAAARTGPAPAVVREWAIGQGIPVSPRGRVAADVVARYETANP
jgi:hypothetical protein